MIYVVNVANKIIKILNMRTDIYLMACLCGHLPPLPLILQLNDFPPPVPPVGISTQCGWKKERKNACACVRTISKERADEEWSLQKAVPDITHAFDSRMLGLY